MILQLPNLTGWATIVVALFTIIGSVAAIWAFNRYYAQAISRIQAQTIDAYKEKDHVMTEKVARLEAVLTTIRSALKRQGIEITIDDDMVTMRQTGVRKTTAVRVKRDAGPGGTTL